MSLSYKLDTFEGPLDLLLHLIEKEKINIYDIPILRITEQYLAYIRQMEEENLDIMSEFLVMAATLIDIKVRMLLPRQKDEKTQEEIDPRQELVERLLEYKRYKELSRELNLLEEEAFRHFFKLPTIPEEVARFEVPVDLTSLLEGLTVRRLKDIYLEVLRRKENRVDPERSKFGEIKKERVSLGDKIESLLHFSRTKKRFSFRELLVLSRDKTEVVVTFLAVLELMKLGRIVLSQEEAFSDIWIERNEASDEDLEIDLSELEDI